MAGPLDTKIIPELDGTSKSVAEWIKSAELVCCVTVVSQADMMYVDVLHAVDV